MQTTTIPNITYGRVLRHETPKTRAPSNRGKPSKAGNIPSIIYIAAMNCWESSYERGTFRLAWLRRIMSSTLTVTLAAIVSLSGIAVCTYVYRHWWIEKCVWITVKCWFYPYSVLPFRMCNVSWQSWLREMTYFLTGNDKVQWYILVTSERAQRASEFILN